MRAGRVVLGTVLILSGVMSLLWAGGLAPIGSPTLTVLLPPPASRTAVLHLLVVGGCLPAIGLALLLGGRWLRRSVAVAGLGSALSGEICLLGGAPGAGIPMLLLGSLLAVAAIGRGPAGGQAVGGLPRRNSLRVWAFVAILAVTLLVRFYRLDNFEQRLCFSKDSTIDVAYKGEWAMDFLAGKPYTPFIQHWGERETLYIYVEALFILLFGQNLVSLTLVSILCGFFTVIFTIWLVRRLFGPGDGLLAGYLLALSPWLIATNRISERFNAVPFFASAALLALVAALQEKKTLRLVLGGAVLGIGLWSFPSYRVVPVAAAAGWLFWFLAEPEGRRRLLRGLPLYWGAFAVAALAPLKFSLRGFVDHFLLAREHGFKMFTHAEDIARYLADLAGFFHHRFHGDMSYWSTGPLVHPVLGVFLLVGLLLLLLRSRHKESRLLLTAFAVSLLPVVVSEPVPRRMGVTLVVGYAVIAHGLVEAGRVILAGLPRFRGPLLAGACAAAVTVIGGFDLVRLFTVDYDVRGRRPCALYRMQEFVRTVGPSFSTYTTHMGEAQQLLRFYKHSDTDDENDYERQTIQPLDEIPLHRRPDKDVLIVIGPEAQHQRSIPFYRGCYPGAVVVDHRSTDGKPMFTSLFVSRAQVEARQGLRFTCKKADGSPASDVTCREAGFRSGIPAGLPLPLEGAWEGSFFMPAGGVVRFRFSGSAAARLYMDNLVSEARRSDSEAGVHALFLCKGAHDVRIEVRAGRRSDWLGVEVMLPGREFTPFPWEYFTPVAAADSPLRAPASAGTPLQFERVLGRRFDGPFADEPFVPRQIAVDAHNRLFLADSERVTIARYSAEGQPDFAFRPFTEEVEKWSGKRPFSGERQRGILLRVTGPDELLAVDQSRNVLHGFDLEGNRRWRTELDCGPVQSILPAGEGDEVWFLAGTRLARLDRETGRVVPLPAWDGPLSGHFDLQAAAVDGRQGTVYLYDGAYETILAFDSRGEPVRRLHNLGRHDNVRMELLPEGILLFSGLRTHNLYAFARDGSCLLGSRGDPPVNILGWDDFGLVTDLAVAAGGERIYVIDHDGFVQAFARAGG